MTATEPTSRQLAAVLWNALESVTEQRTPIGTLRRRTDNVSLLEFLVIARPINAPSLFGAAPARDHKAVPRALEAVGATIARADERRVVGEFRRLKLDLRLLLPEREESWGATLLVTTGPAEFVTWLQDRWRARAIRYDVGRAALVTIGGTSRALETPTEQDALKEAGLYPSSPEERTDWRRFYLVA